MGPWLGATDVVQEGVWRWITGEAWTYSNWLPGEPNNHFPGEHYLHFFAHPNSPDPMAPTWNDEFNEYPYNRSYLVEYETEPVHGQVPEPTSLVLWSGLGVMGLISARRGKSA